MKGIEEAMERARLDDSEILAALKTLPMSVSWGRSSSVEGVLLKAQIAKATRVVLSWVVEWIEQEQDALDR